MKKINEEKINVIMKDMANKLVESSFFLGNIISISYFPEAITPQILHILIYKPQTPNSSGEKYCVNIGVIKTGINCAIDIPVNSLITFFEISENK